MKPKVSFLIPTKNRAKYIKDRLDSLIGQEIKEWEAIVVNDHGNDETKKIIDNIGDERINFFELNDYHVIVTMKRKILLDNPYNSFFRVAEDYELISRLAVAGKKFIYKNIKVVKYRVGNQNISMGGQNKGLVKKYGLLVGMVRGWQPFDKTILGRIDALEKGKK